MNNFLIKFKNYGLLELLVFSSAIYVVGMLLWTASTRSAVEEKANTVKSNHKQIVDFINTEINNCNQGDENSRTIWGDHNRFVDVYFSMFPGKYFTGDGCRRDSKGYYWITGRVDDVLNVSGHRMGTAEFESVLVTLDEVAEAAVVGFPHSIKGTGVYAFLVLQEDLLVV